MAVSRQQTFALDDIPAHLRQNAIDSLLAGKSSRDVSAYLLQHGHKVSHAAVARYNKFVIRPAMRTGAKLRQIEQVEPRQALTVVDEVRQIKDVTREALRASPILARLDRKFSRLDPALEDAAVTKNYDALAKLEAQDTKALEVYGRALGDPNFTSAAQTNSGQTIQIAINVTPVSQDRPADVQVIDIVRE